ncbi:MAG: helix-turn-helix domain-containing protein, partial [Clostridium sp.]|nr:helix-turn-helix domain-containing protein [Clostridium sp.]
MACGEILLALRKEHGYTQKKVAGCLGISKSALSNYEKSIHHPPYGVLVKLGDLYG